MKTKRELRDFLQWVEDSDLLWTLKAVYYNMTILQIMAVDLDDEGAYDGIERLKIRFEEDAVPTALPG